MPNTVLIKGKGSAVKLTLLIVQQAHYPHATWSEPKLKWWQASPRYELRIQNLTAMQIRELHDMLTSFRPLSSPISLEVF